MKQRWAAKRDIAESPIIYALEKAGYQVYALDYPCDLACRKSCWPAGVFQFLEVKTGHGKKLRVAKDKRQEWQTEFLANTKTPIVRTPEEALRAVSLLPMGA